jgi:hypothetical protein
MFRIAFLHTNTNIELCVMAGHIVRMGENKNTYRCLVGNEEAKRPLARPRRR